MAFRVKAKQLGYYGEQRRHPGQIFRVQKEADFSANWMEREDADGEQSEGDEPKAKAKRGRPPKSADADESVI